MKKIISLVLVLALLMVFFAVPAAAQETDDAETGKAIDFSTYIVRLGDQTWQDFFVDGLSGTVTFDDLDVSVVADDWQQTVVPEDAYTVSVKYSTWEWESGGYVDVDMVSPYGIMEDDEHWGYSYYYVYAEAKKGSGYTGTAQRAQFCVKDVNSFYGGLTADFHGNFQQYRDECYNLFYEIPINHFSTPDFYDLQGRKLTEGEDFTINYYHRYTDPDKMNDDDYYETAYPRTNPLAGLPTEEGSYFVVLEAKGSYYGEEMFDFDLTESQQFDLSDYEIKLNGEDWYAYPVNGVDKTLTQSQLNITLCDEDGYVVPKSEYTLDIQHSLYYDDEQGKDVTEKATAPYGIYDGDDKKEGFSSYLVTAKAKKGGKFTGQTEAQNFMIVDTHTLNYVGCNATFGEEYERQGSYSWHNSATIPYGRNPELVVKNVAGNVVPNGKYKATYYRINTEAISYDDKGRPMYEPEDVYPETDPLDGFPDEYGDFFVKIEGLAPYYGVGYLDIYISSYDPEAPNWYAQTSDGKKSYHPGGYSIFLKSTDQKKLRFIIEEEGTDLIPGWLPDEELVNNGFTVDYQDIDGVGHAVITSKNLKEGAEGKLRVGWYHYNDVFDDNHVAHWDTAVPVWSGYFNVMIPPEKQEAYMIILGETDKQYHENDTMNLEQGRKYTVVARVNYTDEQLIPIANADDLKAKGFNVDVGDPMYARIDTTGTAAGTSGILEFKMYSMYEIGTVGIDKATPVLSVKVKVKVTDGTPSEIVGDADGDGDVTVIDATRIQQWCAHLIGDDGLNLKNAKTTDRPVSVVDATRIQQYCAKIISEF